jgi:hypothetical protein
MYQIEVRGTIHQRWVSWFAGMTIATDVQVPVTTLTGTVPDQAALRGILNKLWDLNLDLISVRRISKEA